MSMECSTRYPLLLVHGAGFRDLRWPVYWGRIPGALEARGAQIFYGNQDCWASIDTNAEVIGGRIAEITAATGAEKVNIIAHSKGGLDARRAAGLEICAGKIASITTIATPHHGSETIARLFALPHSLWNTAAFAVNNWIRLVGDREPDFLTLCRDFTPERMEQFNRENPDDPWIFCQSFACEMGHPLADINLSTANFVVGRIEGPNDGLVSVRSAQWGSRFTVIRSPGWRGISHLDAIDLRRAPFSKKKGHGVGDICDLYVDIVKDLKSRGL